ncbi:MAG: sigma-70 family RNA polymerase sigma factor [Sphingomonadales bacterium]
MIDRVKASVTALQKVGDDVGDDVLIAAVAGGDEQAYALLVDRHLQPAYRFALRMVGRTADAEDAAQEAFIRVWGKAGQWQPGRGSFRSWFYRLLYNLCIDLLRRRPPFDPEPDVEPPGDDDPASTVIDGQRAEIVKAALGRLPERQRAALLLTYYEGLSNREAADAMKVGVKGLEALLVRGRRALARDLGGVREELLQEG